MKHMEYIAPEVELIEADTDILTSSPNLWEEEKGSLGGVPLT